jgi:hypothetical protein
LRLRKAGAFADAGDVRHLMSTVACSSAL